MTRRVVLVGMMGSGKTAVGRRVAARMGARFHDTDEMVVVRAGKPVRRVFEEDGEAEFRRLESESLLEALASPGDGVIAAAGGSVISAENRAALRSGASCVVWLDADVATLVGRTRGAAHRPLIDDDPSARLDDLDKARRPIYDEICSVRIDTVGKSLDEVVAETLAAVAAEVAT